MKSLKYINILIIILLFSSCDNCTKPISDNALFNVWVKYDNDFNDSNTFRSADKLEDNLNKHNDDFSAYSEYVGESLNPYSNNR